MKNWTLQIDDGLARLTLKTEIKGNRLTPEVFAELNDVLRSLDLNVVRGLILVSQGADFTQGFDLSFILKSDQRDPVFLYNIFETCNQALDRLYKLQIPSMTIINGSCIGGGLLMAMATDFRVADAKAKFGFPEVKQSLVVNLGLKRVFQVLGENRTKELVLLGKIVTAQTMHNWGVINWVVDQSDFEERIKFFKQYINSTPPLAVRANKELIQKLHELTLEESIEIENKLQIQVLKSDDFAEAINSFLEKRKPFYKGK